LASLAGNISTDSLPFCLLQLFVATATVVEESFERSSLFAFELGSLPTLAFSGERFGSSSCNLEQLIVFEVVEEAEAEEPRVSIDFTERYFGGLEEHSLAKNQSALNIGAAWTTFFALEMLR